MQNPTQSSLKPLSPCFQAAFPCKGRLKFRFQTASNATTRNAKADSLYTPKGNRISEFDGTRYIYDELGNTKLRELPDGETQLYTCDTENQLSTATVYKKNGSIEKWRYAYDPFGRRLSKERIDKGSLKSTNPKCTVVCVGRHPDGAGVQLQRGLHLSLHRSGQLRALGPCLL